MSSTNLTYYQQVAGDFMTSLDALAAILPRRDPSHSSDLGFLRSHTAIPLRFIGTAATAVEQSPELQCVNLFDISAARDTLLLVEAFRPLLDKLTAVMTSLRLALDARHALDASKAPPSRYNKTATTRSAIACAFARRPGRRRRSGTRLSTCSGGMASISSLQ